MENSWPTKTLGEICDINAGNSAPQNKMYFDGGSLPFFRTSDVGKIHHGFIDESADKLNNKGVKKLRLHRKGSLLFPKSGASTFLNHRVLMDIDGYVSSHLAVIKACNNKMDDKYLWYFSMTIDSRNLMQDQNYPSLRLSDIENIPIPLPPLPTQRRIVQKLDKIFAATAKARENAEKNLKNSRELFEAYLNNIFASQGEGWEEVSLGSVCDDVEYGTSAKSRKVGRIPVIRMGNVQNGRLNWDKLVYTNDGEEIKKYKLKMNDVLFNRTNSEELVGKTAIYKGERPAIFAGYLIRINVKKGLLDPDFLNLSLNSKGLREYGFSIMTSSVNQANISGGKLKTYPLLLPPLKQQRAIVKKLDALAAQTKKLEAIYRQKVADLEELKKSVLRKAFEGELRL